MDSYDHETERYLKEFRPQAIRELEVPPQRRNIFGRRFAVAAAVALCAGFLLWFTHRERSLPHEAENTQAPMVGVPSQRPYGTTLALTMLAFADNERFETLLTEESRKSLPGFQGERSGLKILAKD